MPRQHGSKCRVSIDPIVAPAWIQRRASMDFDPSGFMVSTGQGDTGCGVCLLGHWSSAHARGSGGRGTPSLGCCGSEVATTFCLYKVGNHFPDVVARTSLSEAVLETSEIA